jgi:hypothetical protein
MQGTNEGPSKTCDDERNDATEQDGGVQQKHRHRVNSSSAPGEKDTSSLRLLAQCFNPGKCFAF